MSPLRMREIFKVLVEVTLLMTSWSNAGRDVYFSPYRTRGQSDNIVFLYKFVVVILAEVAFFIYAKLGVVRKADPFI